MNFCFGRFWKNLRAPPIHYGVFDLFGPLTIFFQILLVGVALGKAPIVTTFLVKQTELALVRPLHPPLLNGP